MEQVAECQAACIFGGASVSGKRRLSSTVRKAGRIAEDFGYRSASTSSSVVLPEVPVTVTV